MVKSVVPEDGGDVESSSCFGELVVVFPPGGGFGVYRGCIVFTKDQGNIGEIVSNPLEVGDEGVLLSIGTPYCFAPGKSADVRMTLNKENTYHALKIKSSSDSTMLVNY